MFLGRVMLRIEKRLPHEGDDTHQRLRIRVAADARPVRERHVKGDRTLHHHHPAPRLDDVADLRLVGRRDDVHQRALAGDDVA